MHSLYQTGATLEEVGERYGITRERVRQLFKKAGLETRSRRETLELNPRPGPPVAEMGLVGASPVRLQVDACSALSLT
jgi:Sigma-70, region 4